MQTRSNGHAAHPQNAKTQLVMALQKYCGRTLTKADVVYTTYPHGEFFQSSCALVCVDGRDFWGDICSSEKDAERSAADQALSVAAALAESLDIGCSTDVASPGLGRRRNAGQKGGGAEKFAPHSVAARPNSADGKSRLVTALQSYVGRRITQADVSYQTVKEPSGLFLTTVVLACVGGQQFVGESCSDERSAHNSAAARALEVYSVFVGDEATQSSLDGAAEKQIPLVCTQLPKSLLTISLQKMLGRALTKADVLYTVNPIGDAGDQFLAAVRLACVNNEEYWGEVCATEKEAEHSAASTALQTYPAPESAMFVTNGKTELVVALQAHVKRTLTKQDIVYNTMQCGEHFYSEVELVCVGGLQYCGELCDDEKSAEHSAAQAAIAEQDRWPCKAEDRLPAPPPPPPVPGPQTPRPPQKRKGAPFGSPSDTPKAGRGVTPRGAPQATNPKHELLAVLAERTGRVLHKQDVTYSIIPHGVGRCQAVVTLVCTDGAAYTGEISPDYKTAEQSAASVALAALRGHSLSANAPPPPPPKKVRTAPPPPPTPAPPPQAPAIEAGGDSGKSGGKTLGIATPKAPGIPQPAREPLLATPITGDVVEWTSRGFGWIVPHAEVDHPQWNPARGRIFVHQKELMGAKTLAKGSVVQFNICSDAKGMSAMDVLEF